MLPKSSQLVTFEEDMPPAIPQTLQEKMREYMDNGARLGWLIDPKNRRVEIYRQGQEVEVQAQPQTLSGEEVLPGLVLQLDLIW